MIGSILPFLASIAFGMLILPLTLAVALLFFRHWYYCRGNRKSFADLQTFAFFHPYCSGGGGGERVLWKIVQHLQQEGKNVVIFTIDEIPTNDCTKFETELRQDAQRRFDVQIPKPIQLISLSQHKDKCLSPKPFLSLVMESIGTMELAYHAFQKYDSDPNNKEIDVFCDTTGCAFSFLVTRWMKPQARILAYVHYPTISTDMMAFDWQKKAVDSPEATSLISIKVWIKKIIKLTYHWIFAVLYGITGSLADLVMVNSTWTYNHIRSLWRLSPQIHIVYPPCRVPTNIEVDSSDTTETKNRQPIIVSIAQFRPEKNHALQIEALKTLFQKYPQHQQQEENVKLLLIGSCRNDEDQQRVQKLRDMIEKYNLTKSVAFNINPPYAELQESMRTASIGIHTMRQEHFGIGIVEMMAAGLLVVAHNSGGPKSDIVARPSETGFLATTAEEYADALHQALTLPLPAAATMREQARLSATRFSDQEFEKALAEILPKL